MAEPEDISIVAKRRKLSIILLFWLEAQTNRVHTIPLASAGWAVVEHMAQMRIARSTYYFRAVHAMSVVFNELCGSRQGLVK